MSDESANDQAGSIRLKIEGDRLALIASTVAGPGQPTCGSISGIRHVLAQGRLTEASLESAITQVEDLIMPIIRTLPASTKLKVSGVELEKVFRLLSVTDSAAVPIESVESLFNQLADYTGGSPVAWRQDSSPVNVALGLVVLREVMHHGAFRSVSLVPPTE